MSYTLPVPAESYEWTVASLANPGTYLNLRARYETGDIQKTLIPLQDLTKLLEATTKFVKEIEDLLEADAYQRAIRVE